MAAYQLPGPGQGAGQEGATDSYSRVTAMLKALHMTELFPKFTAAMIKVMGSSSLFGLFGPQDFW